MSKVYVLLNTINGNTEWVAEKLRARPGVTAVDIVEGPHDVIMVVEAPERQKLAQLTILALASVENATGDVRLLPARNGKSAAVPTRP